MFNYKITRLPCLPVFCLLFTTGIGIGGLIGLLLGCMAWDTVGIVGGAFFGLLCGVTCGLVGLALAVTFNILAPYIGGLPIKLEAITDDTTAPAITKNIGTAEKKVSAST